jgi:hypothetical protein
MPSFRAKATAPPACLIARCNPSMTLCRSLRGKPHLRKLGLREAKDITTVFKTPARRAQMSINGKADKFRAIAERRVSNVLKTLRHIGNLSNRSTYDYSPDQINKMFKAIRAELDVAEDRFKPKAGLQEFTFE